MEIFRILQRSVLLAWQGRQFVAKAHVIQRVHTAGGALFPGDRLKSGPLGRVLDADGDVESRSMISFW